jgi:ATP-binding cassette, subfamily B, bacterial MsbA
MIFTYPANFVLSSVFGKENAKMLFRLFRENFRKHYGLYTVAIIAMLVTGLTTAASAWMMKEIVNGMVVDKDVQKIFGIAATVATIFTIKGIASYIQSYYLSKAGSSIVAHQQRRIFDQILKSDLAFIQSHSSADLLMRVTQGAQAARAVIDVIVTSFVRDLFTLVSLVVVMFIQQPVLSLISFVFGPIALIGLRMLLKNVRAIMRKEMTSFTDIIRIVQEASTGFRIVKSYGLEPNLRNDMNKAVTKVQHRSNSISKLQALTSPLMETLAGFAIAGAIALSAVVVLQHGNTPGELVSFITALLLAYEPAKRLARMRIQIEAGMVGCNMLFEILDHPVVLKERPDAKPLPKGAGHITFDKVQFSYRQGLPVLKQVDLSFESGKITALVGPSGSGKSTIINLIMRMFDPDTGSVNIDGHDIKDVTIASLRERISYVGQDAFLFAGTVKYNIGLGKNGATELDIIRASKAANAHDFIMALPNGYDTDVGENGSNLSGGQKQRLTIARAFLRDSEILILDEATSALDSEAEVAVKQAVEKLSQGRTTIVIAHRLSTVASADHIIVMKDGEVAEQGKPAELLKQNGLYRRLYQHQFLPEAG